jgi:hypothetical protein
MRSCAGHRAFFIATTELKYSLASVVFCTWLGIIPKDIASHEHAIVHGFA